MTKRIALLTAIFNFIGYYVTDCACIYAKAAWPTLALLLGNALCATINSIIALACLDIPLTVAICWLAAPTTAGALLAAYFWHNPLGVLFGALAGLAATPLIVPKTETKKDDANAPASA
jgi:hypothetical protein